MPKITMTDYNTQFRVFLSEQNSTLISSDEKYRNPAHITILIYEETDHYLQRFREKYKPEKGHAIDLLLNTISLWNQTFLKHITERFEMACRNKGIEARHNFPKPQNTLSDIVLMSSLSENSITVLVAKSLTALEQEMEIVNGQCTDFLGSYGYLSAIELESKADTPQRLRFFSASSGTGLVEAGNAPTISQSHFMNDTLPLKRFLAILSDQKDSPFNIDLENTFVKRP